MRIECHDRHGQTLVYFECATVPREGDYVTLTDGQTRRWRVGSVEWHFTENGPAGAMHRIVM